MSSDPPPGPGRGRGLSLRSLLQKRAADAAAARPPLTTATGQGPPSGSSQRPPSATASGQGSQLVAGQRPPSAALVAGQRPPSSAGQRPPSAAGQGPPAGYVQRPPSAAGQRPPSATGQGPPLVAAQRPPSAAGQGPPLVAAQRPPSASGQGPPLVAAQRPPSATGQRPPSAAGQGPPSAVGQRPPSAAGQRLVVSPSMQQPRSSTPVPQPVAQRPLSRQGALSPTPDVQVQAGVLGGYGRGRGISQRVEELSVSERRAGVSGSPLPQQPTRSSTPRGGGPPGSPPGPSSPSPEPDRPKIYKGTGGKPIKLNANYIQLAVDEGCGIYQYEVLFNPPIDSRDARFQIIRSNQDKYGDPKTKIFDGHKLYLPRQIDDTSFQADNPYGGKVGVVLKYKRQVQGGERESIYIYNLCFNRIMQTLKYAQSSKKGSFFDPKAAKNIKEFKLSVWPGYISAVDVFEGGLMLQVDVASRVLRTDTVRDILTGLSKSAGSSMKEAAEKALLGSSVITKYNNKNYKIDGIDFNDSPKGTFLKQTGQEMSYMDYYKQNYGVVVQDPNQPMLIHRPKIKGMAEGETERIIKLVPELCFMTGLTDAMRADFRIMKELGNYTRLTPPQRQEALRNYLNRVTGDELAYSHLRNWGLKLAPDTLNIMGRQMDPEILFFGKGYKERVNDKADWGRAATSKNVLTAVPLTKWAIVYVDKNDAIVRSFCKCMAQQGPRMGLNIALPRCIKLPNDRTETYLKEIRNIIDPSVQLVMTIFPQMKSDRYSAIKKLCYVEMPVASQVINLKTISNDKRLASVVQKVALQINCKLGGELWGCSTPIKDLMVVGIDVFHDTTKKCGSIAGIVTSLNDATTRYYSGIAEQKPGQEIVNALQTAFIEGLIKYFETNRKWPENIVVFRDGVGDGQLEVTEKQEASMFLRVFEHVRAGSGSSGDSTAGSTTTDADTSRLTARLSELMPKDYNPGFAFVVVQKRINTRIVAVNFRGNKPDYSNPPPGTIVDHTVTRFKYKDFFLVPQSVGQGTVTPTHFIVLKENPRNPGLDASQIQKLAYKLTHMYYNWPGTVRVPAPVQYAHKLVDLVGQHIHRAPNLKLADKLYYL